MVQIQIAYQGSLRCHSVHGPSGASLHTDAPLDNQGRGESFSPTDLVATALGTCMLTIMGIAATRHALALEGTRVVVTKHMLADPRRRIAKLEVRFALPAGVSERNKKLLEQAAFTCPVHESLNPTIEIPVHFGWGEL